MHCLQLAGSFPHLTVGSTGTPLQLRRSGAGWAKSRDPTEPLRDGADLYSLLGEPERKAETLCYWELGEARLPTLADCQWNELLQCTCALHGTYAS